MIQRIPGTSAKQVDSTFGCVLKKQNKTNNKQYRACKTLQNHCLLRRTLKHQGTKKEVSLGKWWWPGLVTCMRSEAESMRKAWVVLGRRPEEGPRSGAWGILMSTSPGTSGESLSPYGALSSVFPPEGELSFCQERDRHQPGCSQEESNSTQHKMPMSTHISTSQTCLLKK